MRAAELFRDVLARAPDYAPARVGLTDTLSWIGVYVPERRTQALREISELAAETRSITPDHWSNHYFQSSLHSLRHEWADADRSLARMEGLAPSERIAFTRALRLLHTGRVADAITAFEKVLRNDLLSTSGSGYLQQALDFAGRAEEADAEYQRSLDLPGRGRDQDHHAALFRVWNGTDSDLIEDRFDRYLRGQSIPIPLFAAVREVYDDPDAALRLLRAGRQDMANQDHVRQMLIGVYAAHFGDAELALEAMRLALVDMNGSGFHWLWSPEMTSARREPAFKDLVRDLGFVAYWRETGDWGDFCRPLGDDDFECF